MYYSFIFIQTVRLRISYLVFCWKYAKVYLYFEKILKSEKMRKKGEVLKERWYGHNIFITILQQIIGG